MRVNESVVANARVFDGRLAERLSDGVASTVDLTRAVEIMRAEQLRSISSGDHRRLHAALGLFNAIRNQLQAQAPAVSRRESNKDAAWATQQPKTGRAPVVIGDIVNELNR